MSRCRALQPLTHDVRWAGGTASDLAGSEEAHEHASTVATKTAANNDWARSDTCMVAVEERATGEKKTGETVQRRVQQRLCGPNQTPLRLSLSIEIPRVVSAAALES